MAAKNWAYNEKIEEHAVQMFLGEYVLAKANVSRLNIMSSRSNGAVGTLFVTNFKVAFTCSLSCDNRYDYKKLSSCASLDKLLSEEVNDTDDFIPLTVIEHLYAISTSKQKRKEVKNAKKELGPHYDIIEIETKDFRIIQYDFKFTSSQNRKSVIQMLSHYSFPTATPRLFAFDYGKNAWQPKSETITERAFCTYNHIKDYELDLNRLGSSEFWRVSKVNQKFSLCKTFPEFNICPSSLADETIVEFASKYTDNRFPVWLWSDKGSGASLLISSQLKNDSDLTMHHHPVTITDSISKCQTEKGSGKTISIDIGSPCPTLKQLNTSFKKLKKEFAFRSSKEFWETDSTWLTNIEQSGWLGHVSNALVLASNITKLIHEEKTSVIVSDPDGRNFAILITSLVQILLDPYYRSLIGLQAIIQRDWVMKGFPFAMRLGHIRKESIKTVIQPRTASIKGKDERKDKNLNYDGQSPIFLLFIECLHQLIRQNPLEFEYTEQFLILLFDSSYSSLFSTFLMNSHFEYQEFYESSNLMSAWDFIATNIPQSKYIAVFTNAAYKLYGMEMEEPALENAHSVVKPRRSVIVEVEHSVSKLFLWNALFFRWFPCTDFHKGTSREVVLQLQQIQFMDELLYLKDRLLQLQQQMASRQHLSVDSSATWSKNKHKRNASRFSNNEEVQNDFLSVMTGFHFLKML